MDVRHILLLFLLSVCGNFHFIDTIEAAVKSISIDQDEHQIKGKLTYKKAFSASVNQTENTLLFEQNLMKQSSGGYWNVCINGKVLGRLEAHLPQTGTENLKTSFIESALLFPPIS